MSAHTFSVFAETQNWLEMNNIIFQAEPTVESTNDLAKEEAFALSSSFKCYLADQQTQGRGRNTNTWLNPNPGHALMCTFSFALSGAPQPVVTALIGLRVYQALASNFKDLGFALKAPNDIFLDQKKICGILIETVQMGADFRFIIGLGLNVWSHPAQLTTSSHLAASTPISIVEWNSFLKDLLSGLKGAAQDATRAALSARERDDLLLALNKNKDLPEAYVSISPFADLVGHKHTTSWRSL